MRDFCDSPGYESSKNLENVVHLTTDPDLQPLLERMVSGDREALGTFVLRYGALIKRRARSRLRNRTRRLFDSQDILSTVGRRLDTIVRERRVTARTGDQFWSLVNKVMNTSLIEKARVVEALREKEGAESSFASEMLSELERLERSPRSEGFEFAFDDMLALLESDEDRTIVSLWASGVTYREIAEHLGCQETRVRQRFYRACAKLRDSFRSVNP